METTLILKCTCQSEFQDKEYGKGMRLHNLSQKDKLKRKAFCTICSESQRRNKSQKDLQILDGKPWGMKYPQLAIKRSYKTY